MLLTAVPITRSLRNIFKGSRKLVPKGHSLMCRITARETQIFWKSDGGTCVGTCVSCDGFDSPTLCKVVDPKAVWTQVRKSKVKEVTITKGHIQVGRKQFKLQGVRGGEKLYGFGRIVKDLDIEYDPSTGMVGFRILRDPGIQVVVPLKSNTVVELNKVKKLFYGKQKIIKRKHIIMSEEKTEKGTGAGRQRGPAAAEGTTPPPPPGSVLPPPTAPPVAAAPPIAAAPPVAAAPPNNAPTPPTNVEAPAPPTESPAPPTAATPAPPVAPPKKAPTKAPAPATPPPASNPETETSTDEAPLSEEDVEAAEEKDWCDFVRTKAPLKGERNSADKLSEKGWLCLPHAHHALTTNDIREALAGLDNLKAAYLESLYIIASKGTVSDDEKAAIAEQAVTEFKKKLASL